MNTSADLEATQEAAIGTSQGKSAAIKTGRAISIVFFVSIAARLLTIVSQILMASVFGTSKLMDAYVLALIIPTTIAGVLSVAVGAAVIPIFIDYRENRSEGEALRVLWSATWLGTLVALILTGAMIAAAPVLITLFAHHEDAVTQSLAITLLRFLLPIMLLQGLITLFGALLNAYGRFVASSLLPATNAIGIIVFLVLFSRSWGIYALGWGTLAGYALNLLLLIVFCLRARLPIRPVFDWRHPAIRRIAVIAAPALLGSTLAHVNILVDQAMAALLPPGGVSGLNYAVKLVDTPTQFFYLALSTALLPVFAMQVARRELIPLRDTFRQVVMYAALILLPAGVLLSVLARPVVEILYQHGKFNDVSTDVVAGAMLLLAPSMFFVTYAFINARVYQALQDNWTLCYVAVLSLVLNGVLDYLLMQIWGVAGIAFSTTLTYLISAIVLIFILDRKLHSLRLPQLGLSVGKVASAAALMWLGCWFLGEVSPVDRIPLLAQICLIGAAGVLIYLVLLWGLRVREVRELWALLRQRLPLRRQSTKTV